MDSDAEMKPARIVEMKAARIVEKRLGGRAVRNDTGKGDNKYDFKISFPDGSFAALEVTQSLIEGLAKLQADLAKHSPTFSTPRLKRGWYLYLAETEPRYRHLKTRLQMRAPQLLASLEAQGVPYFQDDSPSVEARELAGLGIRFGICHSYEEDGEGFVYIHEPGQGGATGPALIVQCALLEASKRDNIEKLRRAMDANGRHLFVWVRDVLPSIAFGDGPPQATPELPEVVTTLWIGGNKDGVTYVWRVEREGGWEAILPERQSSV